MNFYKYLLIFLTVFLSNRAYIKNAVIMTNGKQNLYFCGDIHIHDHSNELQKALKNNSENIISDGINKRQARYLTSKFKDNTLFIIENMFDVQEQQKHKFLDGRLDLSYKKTMAYWNESAPNAFLGLAHQMCLTNNCPVINIEFRFKNLFLILKFKDEKDKNKQLCILEHFKEDVCNNIEDVSKLTSRFQIINDFYKTTIDNINISVYFKAINFYIENYSKRELYQNILSYACAFHFHYKLYCLINSQNRVKDFFKLALLYKVYDFCLYKIRDMLLTNVEPENMYCSYFSPILDIKTIHAIYNNFDKENIVICLGNNHVVNIVNSGVFQKLGYQIVNNDQLLKDLELKP